MPTITQKDIKEIYIKYFELIDSFFGGIKHHLGEDKESHIDLGADIANYPLISDLIIDAIGDLDTEIIEFWDNNAKILFDYIKSKSTLKCLYSGDITPVNLEDFIKKSCLYVDTVIISDPIYNLSIFQSQFITDRKYYLNKLLRHVFNIWKLKDLILADVDENILMIIPVNLDLLNKNDKDNIIEKSNKQFIEYINLLTNKSFASGEEVNTFFEPINTARKVFDVIDKSKPLPNLFNNFDGFNKFLINMGDTSKFVDLGDFSLGKTFSMYLFSQFIRVGEHKYFCEKLTANPIYDYEVPWFFYNYSVGYEGMDNSIINTLQKDDFQWITNMPIDGIKDIREKGQLDYMRSVLRTSLTDLNVKNDKDLLKTGVQIEENFKNAFAQHELDVTELEGKAGFNKKEGLLTGGATILGFIPDYGIAISLISAGRSIKQLFDAKSEAKEELSSKQDNVINLLMQSYND